MMYGEQCYSQCSDGQNTHFALFKLIKHTNFNLKDAACLLVGHILQHRTSRPSTKWTQNTMVNEPKKHLSPLPAGKHCKSTQDFTRWHHEVNEDKSRLEAESVRALGALHSLQSKKKLEVGKQREMHFLSKEEMMRWIRDLLDRETAVAR